MHIKNITTNIYIIYIEIEWGVWNQARVPNNLNQITNNKCKYVQVTNKQANILNTYNLVPFSTRLAIKLVNYRRDQFLSCSLEN